MNLELEALKRRLFGDNKVKNIKFFPGRNADSTSEDIAQEVNKAFAEAQNPEVEVEVVSG